MLISYNLAEIVVIWRVVCWDVESCWCCLVRVLAGGRESSPGCSDPPLSSNRQPGNGIQQQVRKRGGGGVEKVGKALLAWWSWWLWLAACGLRGKIPEEITRRRNCWQLGKITRRLQATGKPSRSRKLQIIRRCWWDLSLLPGNPELQRKLLTPTAGGNVNDRSDGSLLQWRTHTHALAVASLRST